MSDTPCDLVIKHEGVLGTMAADVSYIRKKVDNGLSTDIQRVSGELGKVERALSDFISATRIKDEKEKTALIKQQAKNDAENWLTRIMSKSMTKLLGVAFAFIVLNSVFNSGLGLFLKSKYSLEPPGQQQLTMQKTVDIQSTLGVPHLHVFPDGTILSHTGDANTPAWLFRPGTNSWERAPTMRTEAGIK